MSKPLKADHVGVLVVYLARKTLTRRIGMKPRSDWSLEQGCVGMVGYGHAMQRFRQAVIETWRNWFGRPSALRDMRWDWMSRLLVGNRRHYS